MRIWVKGHKRKGEKIGNDIEFFIEDKKKIYNKCLMIRNAKGRASKRGNKKSEK